MLWNDGMDRTKGEYRTDYLIDFITERERDLELWERKDENLMMNRIGAVIKDE